MVGSATYSDEEIAWILSQVLAKARPVDIQAGFSRRFGRELGVSQIRYVKNKYGRDPRFNSPLINRSSGSGSSPMPVTRPTAGPAGLSYYQGPPQNQTFGPGLPGPRLGSSLPPPQGALPRAGARRPREEDDSEVGDNLEEAERAAKRRREDAGQRLILPAVRPAGEDKDRNLEEERVEAEKEPPSKHARQDQPAGVTMPLSSNQAPAPRLTSLANLDIPRSTFTPQFYAAQSQRIASGEASLAGPSRGTTSLSRGPQATTAQEGGYNPRPETAPQNIWAQNPGMERSAGLSSNRVSSNSSSAGTNNRASRNAANTNPNNGPAAVIDLTGADSPHASGGMDYQQFNAGGATNAMANPNNLPVPGAQVDSHNTGLAGNNMSSIGYSGFVQSSFANANNPYVADSFPYSNNMMNTFNPAPPQNIVGHNNAGFAGSMGGAYDGGFNGSLNGYNNFGAFEHIQNANNGRAAFDLPGMENNDFGLNLQNQSWNQAPGPNSSMGYCNQTDYNLEAPRTRNAGGLGTSDNSNTAAQMPQTMGYTFPLANVPNDESPHDQGNANSPEMFSQKWFEQHFPDQEAQYGSFLDDADIAPFDLNDPLPQEQAELALQVQDIEQRQQGQNALVGHEHLVQGHDEAGQGEEALQQPVQIQGNQPAFEGQDLPSLQQVLHYLDQQQHLDLSPARQDESVPVPVPVLGSIRIEGPAWDFLDGQPLESLDEGQQGAPDYGLDWGIVGPLGPLTPHSRQYAPSTGQAPQQFQLEQDVLRAGLGYNVRGHHANHSFTDGLAYATGFQNQNQRQDGVGLAPVSGDEPDESDIFGVDSPSFRARRAQAQRDYRLTPLMQLQDVTEPGHAQDLAHMQQAYPPANYGPFAALGMQAHLYGEADEHVDHSSKPVMPTSNTSRTAE